MLLRKMLFPCVMFDMICNDQLVKPLECLLVSVDCDIYIQPNMLRQAVAVDKKDIYFFK